jgi:hypothetical protein
MEAVAPDHPVWRPEGGLFSVSSLLHRTQT